MSLKKVDPKGLEEIVSSGREVLAVFSAEWCGFCRTLLKEVERRGSEIPIVVVDISDDTDSAWEDYRIEAVPTAILFRGGREVARRDPGTNGISFPELKEFFRNGGS